MNRKHLSLFGLKFHPFRPDVPLEALLPLPSVEAFCRRIELTVAGGGFGRVTGDAGSGRSVALRLLPNRIHYHHIRRHRAADIRLRRQAAAAGFLCASPYRLSLHLS